MEAAVVIDAGTLETTKTEPTAVAETALAAENTDAQTAEAPGSEPATEPTNKAAKSAPKTYDSLDSVLKAMTEHEEQLRNMKSQVQEMIVNSAALRKSIKQIVSDAQKDNALEAELAQARRKLATMKNFLSTV